MELFKTTNIDFLGKRKIAYFVSLFLIVAGVIFIIIRGGPKYGVDFSGGTLVHIKIKKETKPSVIREALAQLGISKAELQNYGGLTEYIIRYNEEIEADSVVQQLKKTIFTDVLLQRTEKVGPRVGKELQLRAIYAILIGMGLMLIYIAIRFNLPFGISAVLAVFHDVIITLGIFTFLGRELTISIIAAFLSIVGYSINDSIVVSDRIRENLKKRKGNFSEIANLSINEILSRTIITSATTLLVLVVLFFLGGPILQDFSLTLIVGIIVGTYSSIFVVVSLVADWEEWKRRRKRK